MEGNLKLLVRNATVTQGVCIGHVGHVDHLHSENGANTLVCPTHMVHSK